MYIIDKLVDDYTWAWTIIDRRVDGWLLTSSAIPMMIFIALYLTAAFVGPKIMLNRKPVKLQWILVVYNTLIAALNLHIFIELSIVSYKQSYNIVCESVRQSTDPEEMRIVRALHLYFVSKLIEFLDTVFIILRKKNQQLTFLHVYHHSTMFFFCWIGIRWVPGGCAVFGAIVNSFVHIIMYAYYGLSVLGPNVTKYLWWKKYLTLIQLIQFCVGLVLGTMALLIDCPFPKWTLQMNFFYMVSYIILFGRFYNAAYVTQKTKQNAANGHLRKENGAETKRKQLQTNGVTLRKVAAISANNS